MFVNYVKDLTQGEKRVLFIYDSYGEHMSIEERRMFKENNIVAYALPSHTNGKLQPLDVVTFATFKQSFKNVLAE